MALNAPRFLLSMLCLRLREIPTSWVPTTTTKTGVSSWAYGLKMRTGHQDKKEHLELNTCFKCKPCSFLTHPSALHIGTHGPKYFVKPFAFRWLWLATTATIAWRHPRSGGIPAGFWNRSLGRSKWIKDLLSLDVVSWNGSYPRGNFSVGILPVRTYSHCSFLSLA